MTLIPYKKSATPLSKVKIRTIVFMSIVSSTVISSKINILIIYKVAHFFIFFNF